MGPSDLPAAGWQLSAASVRGKSHVDGGLPNQDSVFLATDAAGEVACAAISDGAGTAARSQEGAELTARAVATRLCAAGERARGGGLGVAAVRSEVEAAVVQVRTHIAQQLGELRDFHCTLVAWLRTPAASFVVQIGDSVALSTRFAPAEEEGEPALDFFPDGLWRLHEADRGEYSNETHFVTEGDWQAHLRVSRLPADLDAVVLMSDGAMDVAMLRGEVFRGFLSNLVAKLLATPEREARDAVIHAWLEDPQTYRVTGDDKSMVVAIRACPPLPEGTRIRMGQRGEVDVPVARERVAPPPRQESPLADAVPARTAVPPARSRLVSAGLLAAMGLVLWLGPRSAPAPSAWFKLDPDAAFVAGEGKVRVRALAGPQVIERIAPDAELEAKPQRGSCQEGQSLRAGDTCDVLLRVRQGTAPGEYGVGLSFRMADAKRSDRRVLELPPEPPPGRPR